MSDTPIVDRRAPAPAWQQAGKSAVPAGIVGLLVASADWLLQCKSAGGFRAPDDALIVLWATALAPLVHLIYVIVENKLKKAAGEN